uniref:Uncharacterized protein n=1 Tax=Romanomermis culicivorax TaxID=13658 RepID=A0A915KYP4_ROMCU
MCNCYCCLLRASHLAERNQDPVYPPNFLEAAVDKDDYDFENRNINAQGAAKRVRGTQSAFCLKASDISVHARFFAFVFKTLSKAVDFQKENGKYIKMVKNSNIFLSKGGCDFSICGSVVAPINAANSREPNEPKFGRGVPNQCTKYSLPRLTIVAGGSSGTWFALTTRSTWISGSARAARLAVFAWSARWASRPGGAGGAWATGRSGGSWAAVSLCAWVARGSFGSSFAWAAGWSGWAGGSLRSGLAVHAGSACITRGSVGSLGAVVTRRAWRCVAFALRRNWQPGVLGVGVLAWGTTVKKFLIISQKVALFHVKKIIALIFYLRFAVFAGLTVVAVATWIARRARRAALARAALGDSRRLTSRTQENVQGVVAVAAWGARTALPPLDGDFGEKACKNTSFVIFDQIAFLIVIKKFSVSLLSSKLSENSVSSIQKGRSTPAARCAVLFLSFLLEENQHQGEGHQKEKRKRKKAKMGRTEENNQEEMTMERKMANYDNYD